MSEIAPSDFSLGIQHWGEATPHKVAVKCESQILTYAELNRAISAFAATLDMTVSRETLLPILVGANLDSYIAISAAMWAGIGFSPIDSSNPSEAIDSILAELGNPKHMVIASIGTTPYYSKNCTIVQVEYGSEFDFPPRAIDKSELACVIFTSGSTGKPKGVMLDWSRLEAIRRDHIRFLSDLKDINLFGVNNSLGFLFGFWRSITVSCGFGIAIIDPFKYTADELISRINEDGISHIGLVPSLLEKICDSRSADAKCTSIVGVLLAGEGSNWEQVAKIKQLCQQDVEIYSSFGASEIQYIVFEDVLPNEIGQGKIPFTHIVHPDRVKLVPISDGSALCELMLFEPIALGYLHDPELTAAKFGVDEEGRRFLRTGDLIRKTSDGKYLHAGRTDDLVKINGRLVEPSESQRVLASIPGIESAVVLPHLNQANKHFLVGHITLGEGSHLTPNQVYEILLSKLASNLVPSMLVLHKTIPLNDRGKIDRQFLINNSWQRWNVQSDASTLTATETFTLGTLRMILRHQDLAVDEDIFGAGMDSFAALEFIAIATEYGFESFTPNVFLQHRNVRSVAAMLDSRRETDFDSPKTLNAAGSKESIFCFPGGGMTALWYREFASEAGPDQPLTIIEPRGLHTDDLPDKSIEEHGARGLDHIIRLQESGPVNIIGHSAGGTIAYEVSVQLAKQGREVKLVLLDSHPVIEKLRTPTSSWKFIFLMKRVKRVLTRPLKGNFEALRRRINSIIFVTTSGRASSHQAKYDHFLMLALESNKNYVPIEPTFPILLLYVQGTERFDIWKTIPTLTTTLVSGTHMNLTEQPYVKEVVRRTLTWLNEKAPQVLQ